MKKTYLSLFCSFLLLVSLAACGGREVSPPLESETETGTIKLTVWGAEEDAALLQEIFTSFQSHYAGQASFQITFQSQSESNCKDALLGDLEGGADVFAWTPLKTARQFAMPVSPPRWKRPAWATPFTPTP